MDKTTRIRDAWRTLQDATLRFIFPSACGPLRNSNAFLPRRAGVAWYARLAASFTHAARIVSLRPVLCVTVRRCFPDRRETQFWIHFTDDSHLGVWWCKRQHFSFSLPTGVRARAFSLTVIGSILLLRVVYMFGVRVFHSLDALYFLSEEKGTAVHSQ